MLASVNYLSRPLAHSPALASSFTFIYSQFHCNSLIWIHFPRTLCHSHCFARKREQNKNSTPGPFEGRGLRLRTNKDLCQEKGLFIQPKTAADNYLSHISEAWHASRQALQPKAVHTDAPLCINWHLHDCGIPKINISTSGARWHRRREMSDSDTSVSTQPLSLSRVGWWRAERQRAKHTKTFAEAKHDCVHAHMQGHIKHCSRCDVPSLRPPAVQAKGRQGVVVFQRERTPKAFLFVFSPHLSGRSPGSQKVTEGTRPFPSTEIIKPPLAC